MTAKLNPATLHTPAEGNRINPPYRSGEFFDEDKVIIHFHKHILSSRVAAILASWYRSPPTHRRVKQFFKQLMVLECLSKETLKAVKLSHKYWKLENSGVSLKHENAIMVMEAGLRAIQNQFKPTGLKRLYKDNWTAADYLSRLRPPRPRRVRQRQRSAGYIPSLSIENPFMY